MNFNRAGVNFNLANSTGNFEKKKKLKTSNKSKRVGSRFFFIIISDFER